LAKKRILPFIEDRKLLEAIGGVVNATRDAIAAADKKIDKNLLDPFSALYDSVFHGLNYEEWLRKERSRQIEKTMSNAIGHFHQKILGGIDGWEDMGKGNLVDIKNEDRKIVAEVKNKYNTCRGADLITIYDELDEALSRPEYKGFQGYFVMIIAKKKEHKKHFTPPDRTTKTRRAVNENIMEISGWLFYDLATGMNQSLFELFRVLPKLLEVEFGYDTEAFKSDSILKEIFNRTY